MAIKLISNVNLTSLTYNELISLISSSQLIQGNQYIISDYRTTYYMPNTNPPELISCSIEPLVVTAATTSSLFAESKSITYPQDIIYYNVENNQTYCTGSTKGYIYRRIDTVYNNDIGIDFRNVKYRRWQLNITSSWTGSITYRRGETVYKSGTNELYTSLTGSNLNNALTTSKWKRFEWDNYDYVGVTPNTWVVGGWGATSSLDVSSSYEDFHLFSTTPTKTRNDVNWDKVHNNVLVPVNRTTGQQFAARVITGSLDIIESLSSTFFYEGITVSNGSIYLIEGIKNNKCGGGFHNNVLGCTQDNIFKNNFHDNTIKLLVNSIFDYDAKYNSINTIFTTYFGGSFEANIMYECHNSNIAYGCWGNLIASGFATNRIFHVFQNNTIGSGFSFNIINGGFTGNTIGNDFQHNYTTDGFSANYITGPFTNNNIGQGFSNNNIGATFKYNDLKYRFRLNTVNANFQYNTSNCEVLSQIMTGSTIVYSTYSKDIVKNQSGTLKVAWWNTSDVYTSSAITT